MPEQAISLKTSKDLDPLLQRIGDARCVFLGEASHGTHEYYTWRTAISKRLIEEKGFNFIAVEGDWPDCYRLNRYVKGWSDQEKNTSEILQEYKRWPTWMWANWEVAALMDWLKDHNTGQAVNNKIGFYGLDVYSLWESMETIVNYLEKNDPIAAGLAKKAIECFEPYQGNEYNYARAQFDIKSSCKQPLLELLSKVKRSSINYNHDPEAALNAEQNAQVAVNAERYYSNMMSFDDNTWNLRDTHMMDSLKRLLKFHGNNSKAIVWEHNTHIGDARYTDMKDEGMINIGQLAREQLGQDQVVLIGFGSYQGSVIAGREWGMPMEEMQVPRAISNSLEDILHKTSAKDKYYIFDKEDSTFNRTLAHRAIGVVYHPNLEARGNYVPSKVSSRYDAFVFIDESSALHPMHLKPDGTKIPETYPFSF